jgi:hypothetical protein
MNKIYSVSKHAVQLRCTAKSCISWQGIRREMYVRKKLRHKTILALHGITAGFGILPSFVYPWMAGGSLRNYLKREYSNLSARQKRDIVSCFNVLGIHKFFSSDLEWAATRGGAWYRLLSVSPVAACPWNSRAMLVHKQDVAHGNLTGVCLDYLCHAKILTASLGQRSH